MTMTWVVVIVQILLQIAVITVFKRRCDDWEREVTWEFPATMGATFGLMFVSLGLQFWVV